MKVCEVCVVGGGITGALCALQFAKAGMDTGLLAGGPIGYGGTCQSAGIVQADPEIGMRGLSRQIGGRSGGGGIPSMFPSHAGTGKHCLRGAV